MHDILIRWEDSDINNSSQLDRVRRNLIDQLTASHTVKPSVNTYRGRRGNDYRGQTWS